MLVGNVVAIKSVSVKQINHMNAIQLERWNEKQKASIDYATKRFGLNAGEVTGYNSGACYDKVWVTTREAAEKVAAQVKGEEVNGGMFHGMPLGSIHEFEGSFEVMV